MIYMVEMNLPDAARRVEWDAWYLGHIRKLLTVPGFHASQRFEAVVATPSPYLALHEVESAALFDDAAYRAKGGPAATGEWQARMTNWHRNLLAGAAASPEVPPDAHLLVLREAREVSLPAGIAVAWWQGVGLDRTVAECGLAIVRDPAPLLDLARSDARIRLFRPLTAKLRGAGG